MGYFQVECQGFVGDYLSINGTRSLSPTKLDVIRSVITIGAQGAWGIVLGVRGFIHRLSIGISTISFLENRDGKVCISDSFSNLDGSEKSAISFWYGQAFTKITMELILGVPHLSYVDKLINSGIIQTTGSSRNRPDFVGIDRNYKWHVVEAKGRSGVLDSKLINYAKRQAEMIKNINGEFRDTASVCGVSLKKCPLDVILVDPDENNNENTEDLTVDLHHFYIAYYHSIIEYLKHAEFESILIDDNEFLIAPLDLPLSFCPNRANLKIGLLKKIFVEPKSAQSIPTNLFKKIRERKEMSLGPDGILVICEGQHWENEE